MEGDACSICAGEGRVANAFGRHSVCPACHGSGRRSLEPTGIRDVTKTKPSHYQQTNKAATVEKPTWPATFEGGQLANEVRDSAIVSADTKARLIREIMDHEGTHGSCTKTFIKKIRKQIRPATNPASK
jgi:hypothetical protein